MSLLDIPEIIEKLKKSRGLSIRTIESELGLSNGSLAKSLKKGALAVRVVDKILIAYPETRAWVREKLAVADLLSAAEPIEAYQTMHELAEARLELITHHKVEIERLNKNISQLEAEIDRLKNAERNEDAS